MKKFPQSARALFISAIALLGCFVQAASAAPSKPKSNETVGNPKSLELNERAAAAAKSGQYTRAEDLFRQSLNIDPMNVTAAFNLAGMYLRNKKVSSAISLLNDYVKKAPNDAGLYARLGDCHFATKNVDLAEPNYKKALELDPNYPNIAERLGAIYTMQKKLADAEKMLLKAAEQKPGDAKLLGSLSSIYLVNKKPERAVSMAKRSLQISPSSEVYITLGNAYEMLKDYSNSVIAFQRAQDLGDSSDELDEKIDEIKNVMKART